MVEIRHLGRTNNVHFQANLPDRDPRLREEASKPRSHINAVDLTHQRASDICDGFFLGEEADGPMNRAHIVVAERIGVALEGKMKRTKTARVKGKSRTAERKRRRHRRGSRQVRSVRTRSITLTRRSLQRDVFLFPYDDDPNSLEGGHLEKIRAYQRLQIQDQLERRGVDENLSGEFLDLALQDHILLHYLVAAGVIMVMRNDLSLLEKMRATMKQTLSMRSLVRVARAHLNQLRTETQNAVLIVWTEGSINYPLYGTPKAPREVVRPFSQLLQSTFTDITVFDHCAVNQLKQVSGDDAGSDQ